MKEHVIILSIPVETLKEHKYYVGYVFKNSNGVYNICHTEEDVIKSNQWFVNLPYNSLVISEDEIGDIRNINPGDKFINLKTVNDELRNKVFTFINSDVEGEGLITCEDEEGNKIISTKYLIPDSHFFIREANTEDKIKFIEYINS